MSKKTLYRTVIQIEILSENPFESNDLENDLEAINYEITYGDSSGLMKYVVQNQKVVGKRAINLIKNHATDPAFFNMDERGNDCEEEIEY